MKTFSHILFPVDLSPRSEAARPVVESWARRFNAKVTLLHTVQIPISSYGGPDGYPIVVDIPGILAGAQARLERFHFDGTPVVSVGDPAFEIAQYAEKNGVDLIMMPTHGYGPFRRLLLGSVTAKVLHDAECPIWTSAHVDERPCQDHLASCNIVCAVDGTASSVPLMQWAAGLAADLGATLRVVHVTEDDPRDAREAIQRLQETAGLNAPVCIAAGRVAEGVQREAVRLGADLLVIGRGVINDTLGRLRTHAYGIIRQSPCPVISV